MTTKILNEEERKKCLSDLIRDGLNNDGDRIAVVSAIEELNKMDSGYYQVKEPDEKPAPEPFPWKPEERMS